MTRQITSQTSSTNPRVTESPSSRIGRRRAARRARALPRAPRPSRSTGKPSARDRRLPKRDPPSHARRARPTRDDSLRPLPRSRRSEERGQQPLPIGRVPQSRGVVHQGAEAGGEGRLRRVRTRNAPPESRSRPRARLPARSRSFRSSRKALTRDRVPFPPPPQEGARSHLLQPKRVVPQARQGEPGAPRRRAMRATQTRVG